MASAGRKRQGALSPQGCLAWVSQKQISLQFLCVRFKAGFLSAFRCDSHAVVHPFEVYNSVALSAFRGVPPCDVPALRGPRAGFTRCICLVLRGCVLPASRGRHVRAGPSSNCWPFRAWQTTTPPPIASSDGHCEYSFPGRSHRISTARCSCS